jgi:hypothetical protein
MHNKNIDFKDIIRIAQLNGTNINGQNEMVTLIDGIHNPHLNAVLNVSNYFNLKIHIYYDDSEYNKLIYLLEIGTGTNNIHILLLNNIHYELLYEFNGINIYDETYNTNLMIHKFK